MQKFLLLFMVTVLAVEVSETKLTDVHRTHLVALNTCPLDGIHDKGINIGDKRLKGKQGTHYWHCSNGCDGTSFHNDREKMTNFTFQAAGEYEVYFGAGTSNRQLTQHIKVKNTDELPLWHLSKEVPKLINQHIFHHLHWKHFFQRFDNFYPNVGKHFHERLETLTKRRDQIATYVLNKHATTEHLDGNLPPDYECVLREGLNQEVVLNKNTLNGAAKNDLIAAFEDALGGESKIIEELTKVMKMAGDIDDDELGEFISADLLPPILESMKTLENDIGTLKGMLGTTDASITQATTQVGLLGMFMFDKTRF